MDLPRILMRSRSSTCTCSAYQSSGDSAPATPETPGLPHPRTAAAAVAVVALLCASLALAATPAASPVPDAGFFAGQVKPILQAHCVSCHSGEKPQGGLRLTSRAALLKGGDSGPAVSLDKPADSLLLAAVNYQGRQMPPQGKLPQAQIDTPHPLGEAGPALARRRRRPASSPGRRPARRR